MMVLNKVLVMLTLCTTYALSLPSNFNIAAIFDEDLDPEVLKEAETAFRYAIQRVNSDNDLLSHVTLRPLPLRIPNNHLIAAKKQICKLIENTGTRALILPKDDAVALYLASLCRHLLLVCVSIHPRSVDLPGIPDFYPRSTDQALWSLIRAVKWHEVALVYDTNETDFGQMKSIIEQWLNVSRNEVQLRFYPITQSSLNTTLEVLNATQETRIALKLSDALCAAVFAHVQQRQLFRTNTVFVVSSLNVHVVNVSLLGNRANVHVFSFRMINPSFFVARAVLQEWNIAQRYTIGKNAPNKTTLRIESALYYDAVGSIAQALHDLDRVKSIEPGHLLCHDDDDKVFHWTHGTSIISYMKMLPFMGVTGSVKFNDVGQRRNFTVEVLRFDIHGNPHKCPPYIERIIGTASQQGFLVDILQHVVPRNFDITFNITAYSNISRMHIVNTLLASVAAAEYDLLAADITYLEAENISSIKIPYYQASIGILYSRKLDMTLPYDSTRLLALLLSIDGFMWLLMGVSLIGVSGVLATVNNLSISRVIFNNSCKKPSLSTKKRSTWFDCFMYIFAGFCRQKTSQPFRTPGCAILVATWWFAALVFVSYYTAALVASLITTKMHRMEYIRFKTLRDLVKQHDVLYGVIKNSGAHKRFQSSTDHLMKAAYSAMLTTASLVDTLDDGLRRVRNEDYILITDFPTIQYQLQRNCVYLSGRPLQHSSDLADTVSAGGLVFVLAPGLDLAFEMRQNLDALYTNGTMKKLHIKWWPVSECEFVENKMFHPAVRLDYIGLIGILFIGCLISLLIAFFERCTIIRRQNLQDTCLNRTKEVNEFYPTTNTSAANIDSPNEFQDMAHFRRMHSSQLEPDILAIQDLAL